MSDSLYKDACALVIIQMGEFANRFSDEFLEEYDGIEYNSTTNPGGYNLAIFNPDLFECMEVNVYDIEKLQYTSKKL